MRTLRLPLERQQLKTNNEKKTSCGRKTTFLRFIYHAVAIRSYIGQKARQRLNRAL